MNPKKLTKKTLDSNYYAVHFPLTSKDKQMDIVAYIPYCTSDCNIYIFPMGYESEMVYYNNLLYCYFDTKYVHVNFQTSFSAIDDSTIMFCRDFIHNKDYNWSGLLATEIKEYKEVIKKVQHMIFKRRARKLLYTTFYKKNIKNSDYISV